MQSNTNLKKELESLERIGINTDSIKDEISVEKNLEKIQSELEKKWNDYFEVDQLLSSLKDILQKKDIQSINPFSLAIQLLNTIKKITELDIEQGKKITELVYPVIYSYLKICYFFYFYY